VRGRGDRAQPLRESRKAARVEVDGHDDRDERTAHAPAPSTTPKSKPRTASTTSSTSSSDSRAWIGSESTLAHASSDTGKSPARWPRNAYAGWRWSGTG